MLHLGTCDRGRGRASVTCSQLPLAQKVGCKDSFTVFLQENLDEMATCDLLMRSGTCLCRSDLGEAWGPEQQ